MRLFGRTTGRQLFATMLALTLVLGMITWTPRTVSAADEDEITVGTETELQTAVNGADKSKHTTIRLSADMTKYLLIVPEGSNITIDANGHVFEINSVYYPQKSYNISLLVESNSRVNIINSGVTGSVTVKGAGNTGIFADPESSVSLEGDIVLTGSGVTTGVQANGSTVTITGNVSITGGSYGYGVSADNSGTITIEGNVSVTGSSSFGVTAANSGAVTIKGNVSVPGSSSVGVLTYASGAVYVYKGLSVNVGSGKWAQLHLGSENIFVSATDTPSSQQMENGWNFNVYTYNGSSLYNGIGSVVMDVTVAPNTGEAKRGENLSFTAEVELEGAYTKENNPELYGVKWRVSGNSSPDTVIDKNGELFIGLNETATELTVTATSKIDDSYSGTATVSVVDDGTVSVGTASELQTAVTNADKSKHTTIKLLTNMTASLLIIPEGSDITIDANGYDFVISYDRSGNRDISLHAEANSHVNIINSGEAGSVMVEGVDIGILANPGSYVTLAGDITVTTGYGVSADDSTVIIIGSVFGTGSSPVGVSADNSATVYVYKEIGVGSNGMLALLNNSVQTAASPFVQKEENGRNFNVYTNNDSSLYIGAVKVSFDSDGGSTVDSLSVNYNSTATKPSDPTKMGYTFDGWYIDAILNTPFLFTTLITGDTVLYAKWTMNLTYTAGLNGTIDGQPSVTQSVYQGLSGTAVTAIPNTGYVFDKWNDNNTNATRTDENVQSPISVTASFVKEVYTVSFESNGAGTTIPNQTIAYQETVTRPEDPVRTGYTFDGWYSDASLNTPFVFTTSITGNTVLYAKWQIKEYTLNYTAGPNGTIDGQPSVTQSVYQGLSGTAVTALPNTGYVFEKWSDNNTNATRTDENVQGPISVTANFVKEVYTVSFTSNGGSAVPSQNVPYNEYANAPTSFPTLDGYSFVGWYSDSDLNNSFNFVNTPITENTTLFAKWIIVPLGAPVIQLAVAGDSNISITWSSVDTATQYHVFQSTTSGSYGVMPTISVSDSVYSYQATGLTNGTTYYFVVSAVNAGGDGVDSIEVSATPKTVPQAPTNVTATAGNGSASIHFTPPTDNGGSPITGYKIIWTSESLTVTETSTPITITGLTNGTAYTFTVQAINSVGNSFDSAATNEVTPVTPTYGGGSGGGSTGGSTELAPTEPIKSTNGQITVPIGQAGEASLTDEVVLVIPVGAAEEALSITMEKLVDTANLASSGEVFVSPVFELLKNVTDNFMKPVTLTFKFDRSKVEEGQRVAIFYYDEVNLKWVEVGGQVEGDSISAEVDHFTKFAVLVVNEAKPETIEFLFSDINNHWGEANIKQAVQQGIVNGYPDGTFKPNATVTRSEFMVMLMNAIKPVGKAGELNFTDMSAIGAWARPSIEQAVEAGILSGYSDGSFRPNAKITRAELAVIIARALGMDVTASTDFTGFADDSQIPAWAKAAVAAVKELGIVSGRNGDLFASGDTATRAEAVTVIMKLLQVKLQSK
jgi:uncharacterized repeat protein (TIGR02543 family)